MGKHSLFVIGDGFAFSEGDGSGGAGGQTVAQTVAEVVAHKARLAVYDGDGALVAGIGAGAAAVAFILIDMNYLSLHDKLLFLSGRKKIRRYFL